MDRREGEIVREGKRPIMEEEEEEEEERRWKL